MSEYIVNLDGELGMALAIACAGAGFAREEIVRCRNCKHYNNDGCSYFVLAKYILLHIDNLDGYCAWGIRKEEYDEIDC